MKLACEVQLLTKSQITGIGAVAQKLIEELSKQENTELILEYFAHNYVKKDAIHAMCGANVHVNFCVYFNDVLYKAIWPFLPIPYRWLFGKSASVHLFFNYYIPPGVYGKKVVIVHDMAYLAYPETLNRRTRIMLNLTLMRSCKRADIIVAVSEFTKLEIIKYLNIPQEKIIVMPNGVDQELFNSHYSKDDVEGVKRKYGITGEYFLYLGTLEPRKNIPRLIEAYAALRLKRSDVPLLVLAGRKGWLYDDIFHRVNELGLNQDVQFTGYVPSSDSPLLMRGATAFVFPSLYEGFGLPPLESMACGTPVIVANTASLPEVVGDAGLYVDPLSPEQIADAMERIMDDKDLCNTLKAKGLIRASGFSWTKSACIIRQVCEKLEGVAHGKDKNTSNQ